MPTPESRMENSIDSLFSPSPAATASEILPSWVNLHAFPSRLNRICRTFMSSRNAFLRKTFGRYLSTDIATTLLERDDGLEIAGERRRVTLLMADLRGFTALTEEIDPRDVVTILNDHLDTMSEVIEEHLGTVDEYIGDGILALFGAFETRPDDAPRAVECALAMQHALDSVNERGRARGLPNIAMGVGIATGDVVVGNVGSERRSKFTAIGSPVNLSARLESFANGGETLISPNTYDQVRALVEIDETRPVEPKGFNRVILARRVTSIRTTVPK
jgi:adenylate cyclase